VGTAVITWGVLAATPPHLSHISAQTCTKNNEHEKYETVANVWTDPNGTKPKWI